jgi:hypothetical protein
MTSGGKIASVVVLDKRPKVHLDSTILNHGKSSQPFSVKEVEKLVSFKVVERGKVGGREAQK